MPRWATIAGALLLAAGAAAQLPDDPDVRRLSPADRDAALRLGAERALAAPPADGLPGRIHGEVGAGLDSRGGHAVFGAARVPLGDHGAADFSFYHLDNGRPRR